MTTEFTRAAAGARSSIGREALFMTRFLRYVPVVVIGLIAALPTRAGELADAANAALGELYTGETPGVSVVVSRRGEVRLRAAYGMADLELAVPMAPEHVLRLASLTKQYSAAALLRLVADGKASLDDPLGRYLPDFPVPAVTLSQLLNHSSGIRSYTSIEGYMDSARVRADVDTATLIEVFAGEPVDFAPGEGWSYNNSGYVLVGAVIEAITDQPWHRYLRETLLLPLGITHTDAYSDSELVPGRVPGYQGPAATPERAPFLSMTQPHAAGALMATAADVDRWQVALHGGDVLPASLHERMVNPVGAAVDAGYGYGIAVRQWRGRPAYAHSGGINGFATYALYLPEQALSVVVLANRIGPGWRPEQLALRLAALAEGAPYPVEEAPASWDSAALAALEGTYRINDQEVRTLRVVDGRLQGRRGAGEPFTLHPIAGDRLQFDDSLHTFTIERGDAGEVRAITLQDPWGGEAERAEKISDAVQTRRPVAVPVAELQRLAGRYALMPGFVLTVRVQEEGLEIQATGQGPVPVLAESPTRFYSEKIAADIVFTVPASGAATALMLYQGGEALPGPRLPD